MMEIPFPIDVLELNPEYGSGVFRRRIRLNIEKHKVIAELEDYCHGFRSVVEHDGQIITDIRAETIRAPISICGGATEKIKALIGAKLDTHVTEFYRISDPRSNCTHIYDISLLAIAHCLNDKASRQYDIEIEDEKDGVVDARLLIDDVLVHHWLVRDDILIEPQNLAGLPSMKGFASWVNKTFKGDENEAAYVLQKGLMVASARRWNLQARDGLPADQFGPGMNVCYAYSQERIKTALRNVNTLRDFTNNPNELLKFK